MSWNILPKNVLQYFLTKLKAIFDTKVNKSGDTVNGCLIVQNTGSNFDEGIRINKDSSDLSGYTSFVLGAAKDSAAGIQDGAWWIGIPPIANGRKLHITHNGSTQGETYFEADSANRKSPALHLGWSGNVSDGNSYAVTGDVVYDYINANMLNARPSASGNMNDAAGFGNSMGMINLSGTDETVNPNGGTSWHHFINMSYRETSGSNMWQTQLACKAGTSDIFVRSRSGGSVTAGTAWAAPWVRLVKGILRVSKSCNSMPGKNGVYFEEYVAGSNYNLPSRHYYHIISMQGPDTNYGTQLALGMTTEGAYYRNYNNKTWGSWKPLINTNTLYSFTSKSFNISVSLAAGEAKSYSVNIANGLYTPLAVIGVYTGNIVIAPIRWGLSSSTDAVVDLRNYYSSTASGTAQVTVLYYVSISSNL